MRLNQDLDGAFVLSGDTKKMTPSFSRTTTRKVNRSPIVTALDFARMSEDEGKSRDSSPQTVQRESVAVLCKAQSTLKLKGSLKVDVHEQVSLTPATDIVLEIKKNH